MRILGIDPGPDLCGVCVLQDGVPADPAIMPTRDCLALLRRTGGPLDWPFVVVVEEVESFGMPVGREVFDTVRITGRMQEILEARGVACVLLGRRAVKLHLCGSSRARDANIRQALIDRFGGKERAIGNAKRPGPLHKVKSHAWAALALAVTHAETSPVAALPSPEFRRV